MVPHPGTFAPGTPAPAATSPPGATPPGVPRSAWPFPQYGPPPISGPLPAIPADAAYRPPPAGPPPKPQSLPRPPLVTPRAGPVMPPPPVLRWRRVFPGQEAELRRVRYWLAELLPSGPAREDVVTVAVELAANAVRHTASGDDGFFAVELTWPRRPVTVRVAVADGGARSAPHLAPGTDPLGPGPLGLESPGSGPLTAGQLASDQLSEHGRGLRVVQALAGRTGVCGDHRGRLVWAEIMWSQQGADGPDLPDGYESSLRDIQAVLTARYPEAGIWFGRTTMQWWAMIGRPEKGHPEARRLLTAESPVDLAQLLDVARASAPLVPRSGRGRHGLTGRRPGPRAGLRPARQQAWAGVRAAFTAPPQVHPAPPRIQPVARAVWARFEAR